uniref:Putative cytochrome P450 6a13 n=1 Tax=Lygus hesperus TaxID=30085 RepID=A0A0A9Z5T4_LYGHE
MPTGESSHNEYTTRFQMRRSRVLQNEISNPPNQRFGSHQSCSRQRFQQLSKQRLSISKDADPILGRNPFFLKDEEWRIARKMQTHQHSASKMKILYGYVEEVKDELIAYLNNNLGKKFETQELCARFTTDIVSSCVFGIKTTSHTDESSEFRKRSEHILDNTWRMLMWQVAPKLVDMLKIPLLDKISHNYFYNLVKSVVEMRKEKNLSRADFIQNLIDEKNENFSLMDMTAQTMTFFIDGFASSATEMSFMLFMLAIYPEVQDRLREELNSSKKLDFDTLHHLPYLDAVLNETLRLYPAAVSLNRECNQDTTITVKNKKYEFKVGDLLEIPVYAIHRDPQYFENPLSFDPDRFLTEPNNPALLTFGVGPRACLGSRFAKTQIKAGIAALVQNFRIVPGTNDCSMPTITNNKSLLITPDNEMSVKFEKL